jgi:hypothetical protein
MTAEALRTGATVYDLALRYGFTRDELATLLDAAALTGAGETPP